MTKIRKASAVLAMFTVVLLLAGCSTVSRSDALEIPGSVVELTNGGGETGPTWGYVVENGEVIEMTDCGQPSFLAQHYCESEGGLYHFQWSTNKGGNPHSATITTYNEPTRKLTCKDDADDIWSYLSVCVPVN